MKWRRVQTGGGFIENISNSFQILVTRLTRAEKEGGGIDGNLIKSCLDTVFSIILSYQMDLKPKPAFKFTRYIKVFSAWNKQRWLSGFSGSLAEYWRGNNYHHYHTFCLIIRLYLCLNEVMRGNFLSCVCVCVMSDWQVFVLRNSGVIWGQENSGVHGGTGKDLRSTVRESVFVDYTRITTLATTLDLFLYTPNYH